MLLELIDSHCHLDQARRKGDLAGWLDRAGEAGVSRVITVGTSPEDWQPYRQLAAEQPGRVFFTAGLHPCHVEEGWQDAVAGLASWFVPPHEPVALGEIGLDHFHQPKDAETAEAMKTRQEQAFVRQLEIAYQLDCPVIIHSRSAFDRCVELIDASGVSWKKVVFHCFADGPDQMRILNERGGRASFTGIVTYKSADAVRQAVALQGPERLMVETDAPYLAPVPHRGKPCEPAMVRHTFETCAAVLGMDPVDLAPQVLANTEAFFGLR
ncbi:MAG: TatD family hydrolase [Opitutales bacterium]